MNPRAITSAHRFFVGKDLWQPASYSIGTRGLFLLRARLRDTLASKGIGVTDRPKHTCNSCPADAGTKTPSKFIWRRHDPTR